MAGPSSNWWPILQAAQTRLTGLDALNGAAVKIRPQIAVLRDNSGGGDTFPLVIIAPDKRTWEKLDEIAFDGGLSVTYPVIVAAIIENDFDQASLQWQLSARDVIFQALFTTALVNGITFDVNYNPAPSGVDLSGVVPPLDPSLQQFDYTMNWSRPVP